MAVLNVVFVDCGSTVMCFFFFFSCYCYIVLLVCNTAQESKMNALGNYLFHNVVNQT
jgi:hypothetical protein